MRVWTRVSWNIDGSDEPNGESYSYQGPLVLCDRALQAAADNARETASGQAGNYGGAGQGIQANLVPRLETQATNPEGFGPFGLADMQTAAEQTAAGATGAAKEEARLRAMRTGNAAGVGATTAAAAGEGARATGSAVQSILAKNAELKANQQDTANKELAGIMGEDYKAQGEEAGLIPEDINAAIKSKSVGWMQDWNQFNQDLGGSLKDAAMIGGGGKG